MKKTILLCLASLMLCFFPLCMNAQQSKTTKNPTQTVAYLKSEITKLKKSMMEFYPDFRSVKNINATTVKRASNKLSGGSMLDMKYSVYIEIAYTSVLINEKYISRINAAANAKAKQAIVDEYNECSESVEHMSLIMGEITSLESIGGSMAGLEYSAAELDVYNAWHQALKKGSKERITAPQAKKLISNMRSNWKSVYKDMLGNLTDSDYTEAINSSNERVTEAINKLNSLFTKKAPYKWFANTFKL